MNPAHGPFASTPDRRIGRAAALAIVGLAAAYVATGAAGLVQGGMAFGPAPGGSGELAQGDPWLAGLEILLVLAALAMVVLMAAVHRCAPPAARTWSLAALAFMTAMATITVGVHFVQLVVVRRVDAGTMALLAPIVSQPWRWPQVVFALDLLAWDVFFGLSMLCAAQAFAGASRAAAVRRAMRLAGTLCVLGTLGPASGDLRFQCAAIAGYAFVFPVACLCLARWFAQEADDGPPRGP